MRMILSLSALVLSAGASAAPPQPAPAIPVPQTLNSTPPSGATAGVFRVSPENNEQTRANCRGRIETARAELGLPKLPSDDTASGDPMFIAAVDKLIDGCEVLVMRDNLSDIRPLPKFEDGAGRFIPLRPQ